jgi:pyruvyltransferase
VIFAEEILVIALKQFTRFPNAGDQASAAIVSHLTGEIVKVIGEDVSSQPNLLAIGSILHWTDSSSVIWGTGLISAGLDLQSKPRAILATRGHLTRRRLLQMGIDSSAIVGDPGVFLPELFAAATPVNDFGVVAHYVDKDETFVDRARQAGGVVIDPFLSLPDYVKLLTSCRMIISSSLHGLIFGHAYGIPSVWISLSNRVIGGGFKFYDYYSSLGLSEKEVPACDHDDPLPKVLDSCHLPRMTIDKEALRASLLGALPLVRLQNGQEQ